MTASYSYAPLGGLPTRSLRDSRLFDLDAPPPPLSRFRILTRPKALLATISVALLIVYFVYNPPVRRSERDNRLIEAGFDPDARFEALYKAGQAGWRPYDGAEDCEEEEVNEQIWVDKLTATCLEDLGAKGVLCEEAAGLFRQPAVDLVWTWTNGSDPLLYRWRADVTATLSDRVRPAIAAVRERKTANHFRQHDELRYSVRSAVHAFSPSSLRQLRILTTDLPANVMLGDLIDPLFSTANASGQLVTSARIGQVPTWLDRNSSAENPPLIVSHHTSFFEDGVALPTFNSLSIEAQMSNLANLSEFWLYLNDDAFLFSDSHLTAGDVGAPLVGPVFRIQADMLVNALPPSASIKDDEGEWASLQRANWLLDQRFGRRRRGYLAHIPKALSAPLLREVGRVFHDELRETASSRFRGKATEYQVAFLATHYIIEAHREALLHAFFIGKSDSNADGSLSVDARRRMLFDLGFRIVETDVSPPLVEVPLPRRSTTADLPGQLAQAGIPLPGGTSYAFSSHDGFGMFRVENAAYNEKFDPSKPLRPALPLDTQVPRHPACAITLKACFGEDFLAATRSVKAEDVMRRVAYEQPQCGDCAILQLVGGSGAAGLSAFLPTCDAPHTSAPSPPPTYSTAKRFDKVSLSLPSSCPSRRLASISRILRYTYTLGDSSSRFISMRQARLTEQVLRKMDEAAAAGEEGLPTFLTLNDDFVLAEASQAANKILHNWFEQHWPSPSPYETRTHA
ncbi:3-O-alpha-D-mannopyranosyl-alpha-D-mannopyranose xylosylphosphotransferase [Rhodotorula toruloides]|nr:3-O-alpha-D-mannopyranosyl-alpha-D-mannopyranose xylosylphosphotransferase [Rhodotorula toruloides]